MSWFSGITSKAEALLEKLDQDAAQALQNPESILSKSKLLDQARRNFEHIVGQEDKRPLLDGNEVESRDDNANKQIHPLEQMHVETSQVSSDNQITADDQRDCNIVHNPAQLTPNDKINEAKSQISASDSEQTSQPCKIEDTDAIASSTIQTSFLNQSQQLANNSSASNGINNQPRKFKLQTSKLKRFDLPSNSNRTAKKTYKKPEQASSAIDLPASKVEYIRASIVQSLKSYSLSASNPNHGIPNQTIYSTYFDDQPNIIRQDDHLTDRGNQLNGTSPVSSFASKRNDTSESFSIDVPDSSNHADIASQILRQSALKRKSAFNLHQVINRLANQDGVSYSVFDDKTKLRLRRAQMRTASYIRRLNHYLRVYPKLKYWMLAYLIVFQVLIIYVLFFYQSTSSSTYLSSQVKEQQEGMFEPSRPPGLSAQHQQQAHSNHYQVVK